MKIKEKIVALSELGKQVKKDINTGDIESIFLKAKMENPWFTEDNCLLSLNAIADLFLTKEVLDNVANMYALHHLPKPKNIGLVLAGNIPAVGWHDVQCCFLANHHAMIKFSAKDGIIIPYLLQKLKAIDERTQHYFTPVDRLAGYNAVIATGGNNTSRYFEYYFRQVPCIIRKSRSAVGILEGDETDEEIKALGKDIFSYFGLGCRNVSKIYIPHELDKTRILEVLHEYNQIVNHNKYKNNFDYNVALFLLNKEEFYNNGCLILKPDNQLASRIACLHYEYYENREALHNQLVAMKEEVQCVVSRNPIGDFEHFAFGEAQSPQFTDYADCVDTIKFLLGV